MKESECSGNCHSCGASGGVSATQNTITGWKLVFASLLVFVLPLIAAVVGTLVAARFDFSETGGALAGFGVGLVFAMLLTRRIRSEKR